MFDDIKILLKYKLLNVILLSIEDKNKNNNKIMLSYLMHEI